MDAQRKEALEWFVQFANMDLETIKPGDRAKLLVEGEDYLWPREELKEYQEGVPLSVRHSEVLAWALNIPPKESREYWTAILQSKKVVRELFLQDLVPIYHYDVTGPESEEEKSEPSTIFRGQDVLLWWVGRGEKCPYKMKLLPLADGQKAYLELKIFMLLEGLPEHAIRVCRGCEKFFLNPTGKKKEFCSPKCQWRVNAEKKRRNLKENHPLEYETYLEKQRETMKQNYQKKLKDKLGDKVQIAERKSVRMHRSANKKKEN